MTIAYQWRLGLRPMVGLGLALALSGCLLSPGQFNSALDLRKDGAFTFTYEGEIYILALSRLSDMAESDTDFEEQPCLDDDFEERACTASEIEQQRSEWAAAQERSASEKERNKEAFKAMMGGIDPGNPEAAEELAASLSKQAGWKRVEYKGDGLFSVDFAITSRMSHDFTFPVFERFPMANAFVQANLRTGNVVRIEAPGYSAQSVGGNPMTGMLQAAALDVSGESKEKPPVVPEMKGTFTITTDGEILANNTDEGPRSVAGGQTLTWKVSLLSAAAPMALIRLAN